MIYLKEYFHSYYSAITEKIDDHFKTNNFVQ